MSTATPEQIARQTNDANLRRRLVGPGSCRPEHAGRPRRRDPRVQVGEGPRLRGLPPLRRHVLAEEIADDLRSALEQIESVLGDLQARAGANGGNSA